MNTVKKLSEEDILRALEEVKDPEIPVISVVDLGIIRNIRLSEDSSSVSLEMVPTFAGCPAVDVMKSDIESALKDLGIDEINVKVNYNESWSSNLISEKGRKALKEFGLAPPPAFDGMLDLNVLDKIECPNCGSINTFMMNPFGPTACRSVHHCRNCMETFEQFKPV